MLSTILNFIVNLIPLVMKIWDEIKGAKNEAEQLEEEYKLTKEEFQKKAAAAIVKLRLQAQQDNVYDIDDQVDEFINNLKK